MTGTRYLTEAALTLWCDKRYINAYKSKINVQ